ncbi:MAG: RNA polymerase sigma-70 factor [Bacteroidetes bacterium HGW-Bacteroidetes-8]|jgi:RNA polymerase sigma-70 factor (ECF subfamily)|nr:MAG: RNA polymerase sigma-70 factor [Bacteroidetes bacterium HGW-Bacteroidetes-8]
MANYKADCDKVLVRRLIIGDIGAFEIVYHRYSRELYFLSMAYLNNVEASEDIIQEAFLYMWRKRGRLSENSILGAYLRKIVKNMCLNYIRHDKIIMRHSKLISEETSGIFFPDEDEFNEKSDIEFEDQIRSVRNRLEELPSSCRKIFIMSIIENLSYKDVSSRLGLSVNTIKTQMKIAYRKLRK